MFYNRYCKQYTYAYYDTDIYLYTSICTISIGIIQNSATPKSLGQILVTYILSSSGVSQFG